MSYFTMSQWTATDWNDEMEAMARDKYVPMIMAFGARSVKMVRTGELAFTVVTEYADAAAAEAAQEKATALRGQAAEEFPVQMGSLEGGAVFAQS